MNTNNLLLSTKNYFILHKVLIKQFGIEAITVLASLIDTEECKYTDSIKEDYVLNDLNKISTNTTLSAAKIKKSINKLYKAHFIDVIVEKHNKIYVKILHNNILNYLAKDNIETEIKKTKKTILKSKKFKKPSRQDLKKYFLEIGEKTNEFEIMFDYYESKGWKVGKTPMKCWKSAARNWVRRAKNEIKEFVDYYDKDIEKKIGNDHEKLSKYHKHLRQLGWISSYSPTAGTTWRKNKKK